MSPSPSLTSPFSSLSLSPTSSQRPKPSSAEGHATAASAATVSVRTLLQSTEPRPTNTARWKASWIVDPRPTYDALSKANAILADVIMLLIIEYVRIDLEGDQEENIFGARAWRRLFGNVASFKPHFPLTFERDFQEKNGFLFYRPTHVNKKPLTAAYMAELSSNPRTFIYPPAGYNTGEDACAWDLYKDHRPEKPCYVYFLLDVRARGSPLTIQNSCIPCDYAHSTFLNTIILNFVRYAWTGLRTHSDEPKLTPYGKELIKKRGYADQENGMQVRVQEEVPPQKDNYYRQRSVAICIGRFSIERGLTIQPYLKTKKYMYFWGSLGVAAEREFDGQIVF